MSSAYRRAGRSDCSISGDTERSMADLMEDFRRRMAPVSLRLWPSLANPSWNGIGAARLFGDRLLLAVDPRRVTRKIDADWAAALRRAFLVQGLDSCPTTPVSALYTY